MTGPEYLAYASARDEEYVRSLTSVLSQEGARAKAEADRARFLPDGLETRDQLLVVAEDDDGAEVGAAWLGLSGPPTESQGDAWLFDIEVLPGRRGDGWGRALLAAVEDLATQHGARTLGLNVFGSNTTALALYGTSGYRTVTQQMRKDLVRGDAATGRSDTEHDREQES